MNGSQTMLTIAAIMLFSLLTLNANRTVLNSAVLTYYSERVNTATSIAEELISQISEKAFDKSTVSSDVDDINDFTDPTKLQREADSLYNDIDDYNHFNTTVSTTRLGDFDANVTVCYVNPNSPDQVSTSCTRMKRIKVEVTGTSLVQPLILYFYASY